MIRSTRLVPLFLFGIALSLALSSCANKTDIVAKFAASSFSSLTQALGSDAKIAADKSSWTILSPAGDKATFSADFSTSRDAWLEFDIAPFLKAGLDLNVSIKADGVAYELSPDRLSLDFDMGNQPAGQAVLESADDGFANFIKFQRARVGYHAELDHYGIELGSGNMLEWAKNLSTNDKDLVFVLNPEPFIAAGVDPSKIEGWIYAPVKVKGDSGKMVSVFKFLRPFNIR